MSRKLQRSRFDGRCARARRTRGGALIVALCATIPLLIAGGTLLVTVMRGRNATESTVALCQARDVSASGAQDALATLGIDPNFRGSYQLALNGPLARISVADWESDGIDNDANGMTDDAAEQNFVEIVSNGTTNIAFDAYGFEVSRQTRHARSITEAIVQTTDLDLVVDQATYLDDSLSTFVFGHEPWAQRLPALTAGVLLVPAGYAAARALASRSAALIAAACIASWPYLVDLATNARGYTILLLVFLLLLWLLPRLARGRDPGAWTAFALLGALGFYTTPLMGLLFGVVLVWLVLSALVELPRREWLAQGMRLAGACAAVGGLALVCYAPPIVLEGPRVAFLQSWMLPQLPSTESDGGPLTDPTTYGGVLDELVGRMRLLWTFWTLGQPAFVSWLALAAFGLAIVGARRHPRVFRLIASAVLALLAFVLVFSKTPLHWQLPHLLLVYLIGVAAGAALVLERLAGADRHLAARLPLAVALAFALGNGIFVWFGVRNHQHELPWYLGYYDAPDAAGYLRRALRGDDHVVGLKMELFALAYYSPVDPPLEKRFFPRNYSRAEQELEALGGRPLDLLVIETDLPLPLRERFVTMVLEAGFAPTDDVERLGTSRIVRYSRSPDASAATAGGG